MKKDLFVFFLALLLTNFFGILNVPNTPLLLITLLFAALGYKEKSLFKIPILGVILGLIISIISCKFFRSQEYIESFKALPNYFFILFYFGLKYLKPKLFEVERALLFLILIFNILYILQFVLLQFGIVFIGGAEKSLDAGEEARFRMAASGLTTLGLFYGLNKYLLQKKNIYVIIIISSLVVILLMSFRTMIVFCLIFSFLLIFKTVGFNRKSILYFVGSLAVLILLYNIPVLNDKVQYMINKQQTETFSNDDYIRVVTLNYYLGSYFHSNWEMFLGSGMPFPGTNYYRFHESLNDQGMYFVDWGLWGLSWMIGIISVLAMIWYSIKAFLLKVPKAFYYIGIWFLYLIVSSITTAEFFRSGNFVIQALCLYGLDYIYQTRKKIQNLRYVL